MPKLAKFDIQTNDGSKATATYFVSMSKPSRALLLATHERDPFVAAAAETFPDVRIAVHASGLLGLLERVARGSADTMRE